MAETNSNNMMQESENFSKRPKSNPWPGFLSSLELFSDDFMADGIPENIGQEREGL